MKYNGVVEGKFIKRENRFIGYVLINGEVEKCHIKNTGRCKGLLIEGAKVFLEPSSNSQRKTKYSLVAVLKGEKLINMDSQAPNKVVEEAIEKGKLFKNVSFIKRECKFQNSRFDFYVEMGQKKAFIEVKGVTLEKDGVVSFPDAPSQRAIKHILELIEAKKLGYEAYIIFVIQLEGSKFFVPNKERHIQFYEALKTAVESGVKVLAYECDVEKDELLLSKREVEVRLQEDF